MKLLNKLFKRDNSLLMIPKSVQEVIPVQKIWQDGIFEHDKSIFSKCFKLTDINYSVASKDVKEQMFLDYSALLNSFELGANYKITVINRRLNKIDLEKNILIPLADDGLNNYREEYNAMLQQKLYDNSSIIQDKLLTVSINKNSIDDARLYFNRVYSTLSNHLNKLGSKCIELDATARLKLTHNFYRSREVDSFNWDMKDDMRKGHSFKDYVCPDSFSFQKNYFEMGEKYGRVFFLKTYANYIRDVFVEELMEMSRHYVLSMDVKAIPMEEAIKMGEKAKMGVETNVANWQRKQNNNNNFSAVLPYNMEIERNEAKEFLEDLTLRDQRAFFCALTFVLIANTKEELENETESLLSLASKHSCQIGVLNYQQMDGLNTALPFGVKNIAITRTLTTESLAIFNPFNVVEIHHKDGIYYGDNAISKNMIIADRKELQNGNSFILGVSGSGKSFTAKNEIVSIALKDKNADIIIIDPEREYLDLVKALGGEDIHISATSENHINCMDINEEYGDFANPIILKSEFMLSLCECLFKDIALGAKEKSIIDRCTSSVYQNYLNNNFKGTVPTLKDFRNELLKQEEPEAKNLALAIEMYAKGSLSTFANQTNVNTNNRIVCYDILDLDKDLMTIGMLVILDNILNRITSNRAKGRNTYIFIDEIYLLFQYEYSANFLFTLWKRVRKYGAFCTGITQNVEDLLQSHTARTMLSNSEFLVMLNQSGTDALELSKLLNMTDSQVSYITNVDVGKGLIKIGSSLVPFESNFSNNTKLYGLMTTKLKEKKSSDKN